MSQIDIKHVAKLARLHLTEEESKNLSGQLSQILGFVENLKEVNVEGVEPTSHPLKISNVFRPDEITPSLPIEEFLRHSPKAKGRFFEVPKIIEDK